MNKINIFIITTSYWINFVGTKFQIELLVFNERIGKRPLKKAHNWLCYTVVIVNGCDAV